MRSAAVTAGLLTCDVAVAPHTTPVPGRCTAALVDIDYGPLALVDFNRWVDESVQNALANSGPGQNPVLVGGVGIAADWIAARHIFETATAKVWVAVFLSCPDGAVGDRALGRSLAMAGLEIPLPR